jgi:hypothetical protein
MVRALNEERVRGLRSSAEHTSHTPAKAMKSSLRHRFLLRSREILIAIGFTLKERGKPEPCHLPCEPVTIGFKKG